MSRGDNSGTHAKEKSIWKAAGINPKGRNGTSRPGLGMGQTLSVAAEKRLTPWQTGDLSGPEKKLWAGHPERRDTLL